MAIRSLLDISAEVDQQNKKSNIHPTTFQDVGVGHFGSLEGTPDKPGFFKSLGQSIVKPFAKATSNVLAAGEGIGELGAAGIEKVLGNSKSAQQHVNKASEAQTKERDFGVLGSARPVGVNQETGEKLGIGAGIKDILGTGAEIGSWVVGGGGAGKVAQSTLKGALLKGAGTGLKVGATTGALSAGGQALQEGKTFKEAAGDAALGGVAGAVLGGVAGTAGPLVGKVTKKIFEPVETRISNVLKEAIDKGIKPTFTGTKTAAAVENYYKKAGEAFQVIKKYKPEVTNAEDGSKIVRSPKNRAELLEAIGGAKQKVYDTYHKIAQDAGGKGAQYNPSAVIGRLDEIAGSKKFNPEVRAYAESLKTHIQELEGEAPEVIEARIQDLNQSLAGFYDGRVTKAKAQVDASVAGLMRSELDSLIENTTGAEYQAIKNEYGALKTIEKDVARQAYIEARKNPKGLIDFTDIFSGGDLITGVLTANPALILKGAASKGIKEWIKALNDPNAYIKKAFDVLDEAELKASSLPKGLEVASSKTAEKVGTGVFGDIFEGPKGKEAIDFLRTQKTGEIKDAFFRKEIGKISLPYGEPASEAKEGHGLAHLDIDHPGIAEHLDDIISNGEIKSRLKDRIEIQSTKPIEGYKGKVFVRLNWDGKEKKWIVTAFGALPFLASKKQDV